MQTIRRVLSVSLLALPLLGGCNKTERQVPPGPPPLPAFNEAQNGRPRAMHGATGQNQAMPADHPAFLRPTEAAPTAPTAAAEPAAAAAGAASIAGTIRLSDKLKDKAQAGATIFLIAKTANDAGLGVGPPIAVQRYAVGTWPLPFELTQDNIMIEGSKLQGKVVLSARVDQDGDAMTKQIGDMEGVSKPFAVPAKGIELMLDTVRTQEAGAPSPPNMGGMGGGGMGGGGMGGMGGGATMGSGGMMPPGHPALPPGHPKN